MSGLERLRLNANSANPGEIREFETFTELRSWVEHQRDTWDVIRKRIRAGGGDNEGQRICDDIFTQIHQIHLALNDASSPLEKSANGPDIQGQLDRWCASPWHVEHRVAKWILHVSDTYRFDVLARFMFVVAGYYGDREREGGQSIADALAVALREGFVGEADLSPIRRLQESSQAHYSDFSKRSNTLFDGYEARLKSLEEHYQRVNEFDEPAAYWQKRQDASGEDAKTFGIAAAVFAIAAVSWLVLHATWIRTDFETALANITGTLDTTKTLLLFLRGTFPLLVELAVAFWVLRILVRVFLTKLHQEADAAERVVMTKTYLSLLLGRGVLDGKEGVRSEDAKLILEALFHRSQTGFFQDDASPQITFSGLSPTVK